jgi:thioredoxin reductase
MESETVKNTDHYDVVIVGQGPAAFSAALYAGRYKMSTLIIGEEFGGETATSNIIENYPGFSQVDGLDLMLNMQQQVEELDINIVDGRVDEIVREAGRLTVKAGEQVLRTGSVILAVGRERRKLGLAREKELSGKGIAYCATCDAPLFRDKVAVVSEGG